MKVKIGAVEYDVQITRVRMRDGVGYCTLPTGPTPKIRVCSKLGDKLLMDRLTHEVVHAGAWALDEEVVQDIGAAVAEVLWAAGYRRDKGSSVL